MIQNLKKIALPVLGAGSHFFLIPIAIVSTLKKKKIGLACVFLLTYINTTDCRRAGVDVFLSEFLLRNTMALLHKRS